MPELFDLHCEFAPSNLTWDETISFPNTKKINQFSNRIYNRYPARSVCLVPRAILADKKNLFGNDVVLNVLDTFMGSGTTAVEACLQGYNAFGVEMDPFARLIGVVSTTGFNNDELKELKGLFLNIKEQWSQSEIDIELYPRLRNVEYWFHDNIFQDLLRFKSYTYHLPMDDRYKNFFKIVFADMIKPCSKMERQSTKPYISSKFPKTPKQVDASFLYSFNAHFNAIAEFSAVVTESNGITWLGDNATNFEGSPLGIDIAITSPPYINAFDYTQCIKVESSWVGELDDALIPELRNKQVGHESRRNKNIQDVVTRATQSYYDALLPLDKIRAASMVSYFDDMYDNLICVFNALNDGGEYHMIIGDNVLKGVYVPTHKVIAELAEHVGFEWAGYYKYPIKDHRTSIPRNGNGGKIDYEFVIQLTKN
jgi:DNA modification methylase